MLWFQTLTPTETFLLGYIVWRGKRSALALGRHHRERASLSDSELPLDTLRTAGCRQVYIDGSFVTEKEFPNDYDACWDVTNVRPELLDPLLLKFDNGRVAQKTKYLGDLFPAQTQESETGRTFLEFFQVDKETGNPKGILVLDLRSLEQ